MLAETLKKALDGKGWSARELGRQLDIQHTTVTRWVTGETLPGEERLETLAEILTLDYDELLEQYLNDRENRERKPASERIDALEVKVARIEGMLDELLAELRKPAKAARVRKS